MTHFPSFAPCSAAASAFLRRHQTRLSHFFQTANYEHPHPETRRSLLLGGAERDFVQHSVPYRPIAWPHISPLYTPIFLKVHPLSQFPVSHVTTKSFLSPCSTKMRMHSGFKTYMVRLPVLPRDRRGPGFSQQHRHHYFASLYE